MIQSKWEILKGYFSVMRHSKADFEAPLNAKRMFELMDKADREYTEQCDEDNRFLDRLNGECINPNN